MWNLGGHPWLNVEGIKEFVFVQFLCFSVNIQFFVQTFLFCLVFSFSFNIQFFVLTFLFLFNIQFFVIRISPSLASGSTPRSVWAIRSLCKSNEDDPRCQIGWKRLIFGKNRVVAVRDGELTTAKYLKKCDAIIRTTKWFCGVVKDRTSMVQ